MLLFVLLTLQGGGLYLHRDGFRSGDLPRYEGRLGPAGPDLEGEATAPGLGNFRRLPVDPLFSEHAHQYYCWWCCIIYFADVSLNQCVICHRHRHCHCPLVVVVRQGLAVRSPLETRSACRCLALRQRRPGRAWKISRTTVSVSESDRVARIIETPPPDWYRVVKIQQNRGIGFFRSSLALPGP